jgi:hypothetical protein
MKNLSTAVSFDNIYIYIYGKPQEDKETTDINALLGDHSTYTLTVAQTFGLFKKGSSKFEQQQQQARTFLFIKSHSQRGR